MTIRCLPRAAAAGSLLLLLAFAPGCSDDDDTGTNPPPGGGLELNSGNLAVGASFRHFFTVAGTFPYHCALHTQMRDTITVTASSANDSVVVSIASTSSTNDFVPANSTVKPGGYVRWTNDDATLHTVTSD